jgi:hypothetical protein
MSGKLSAWIDAEPVLTRIGPVVVAVVAYLLAKGIVTADTYDLVVALASAILGGGALGATRSAVTPLPKPEGGNGH